ncbi:hypothetical protein Lal_00023853 [Lupinus albus]|nr:hypothetical protein Lal_00023853 [Lupinus albus]
MIKREDETFSRYVQRWVEVAAQVKPKLSNEDSVSMFIDTLQPPFYGMMLGCVSLGFRQLMTIGEKIEGRLRSDKGLKDPFQHITRDYATGERVEGDASFIETLNQRQSYYHPQQHYPTTHNQEGTSQKRKRKSHYDAIPMLLPQLVQRSLLTILPFKEVVPPYRNCLNSKACCIYHGETSVHPANDCTQLKGKVRDLINEGLIKFQGNVLI